MKESKKTIRNLVLVVAGMFGFGFLLVPIYDVFCEITGLNGKVTGPSDLSEIDFQTENQREVLIQFVTHNNEYMPWIFKSKKTQLLIKTGVQQKVFFVFENTTDKDMVGQVIPSVSPGRGAEFFHKTECFCFTEQVLKPGETVQMPVTFYIDPNIKNDVWENDLKTITLSYTFFMAEDQSAAIKINKSEASLGRTAFGVPRNQIREVSSYIGDSNLKKGEKL